MKTYIIHYRTPGMFTFAPMFKIVVADTEDEARAKFQIDNPNDEIYKIEEQS